MQYQIKKMARVLNIGVFKVENEEYLYYGDDIESNPIHTSHKLREILKELSFSKKVPILYQDEFMVYFAKIEIESGYYLLGPISTSKFEITQTHQFYKHYRVEKENQKILRRLVLADMIEIVELFASIIWNTEINTEELLKENHIVDKNEQEEQQEQIRFHLQTEYDELYHHTYREERKLLEYVKEGNVKEALASTQSLDGETGKLSPKELNHWKNLSIVGITLCTRAAIEGGIVPAVAYQLSDFYIQKGEGYNRIDQIFENRNKAVEALTQEVFKKKMGASKSNYVEKTKDYVRNHYRDKVYLGDIAESLHITTSYLSRLFKKETGQCFQDYVNDVRIERASNLLVYSDEPLARIAEYVNFPSQSYFGKIFKKTMHVSPKKYRELNKPLEFYKVKEHSNL